MELESLLQKIFLAIAGIAVLSCLARPDFNLPLFVFAWLVWTQADKGERLKVFILMAVTLLVDLIWLFYWGSEWSGDTSLGAWERSVQHFALAMSVINFLLKIGAIALVLMTEKDMLSNIPSQLSVLSPPLRNS